MKFYYFQNYILTIGLWNLKFYHPLENYYVFPFISYTSKQGRRNRAAQQAHRLS